MAEIYSQLGGAHDALQPYQTEAVEAAMADPRDARFLDPTVPGEVSLHNIEEGVNRARLDARRVYAPASFDSDSLSLGDAVLHGPDRFRVRGIVRDPDDPENSPVVVNIVGLRGVDPYYPPGGRRVPLAGDEEFLSTLARRLHPNRDDYGNRDQYERNMTGRYSVVVEPKGGEAYLMLTAVLQQGTEQERGHRIKLEPQQLDGLVEAVKKCTDWAATGGRVPVKRGFRALALGAAGTSPFDGLREIIARHPRAKRVAEYISKIRFFGAG